MNNRDLLTQLLISFIGSPVIAKAAAEAIVAAGFRSREQWLQDADIAAMWKMIGDAEPDGELFPKELLVAAFGEGTT